MNNIIFSTKIIGLSLLTACSTQSGEEESKLATPKTNQLPNVVIIYTDDQGFADAGCYGAKEFETPNLDKLAQQGMRFTDYQSPSPVCSASRAAMLTGCYSQRVGIYGALFPSSDNGINPQEITIAEMLKEKGYATGMVGKWHLEHHKKFLPLQHGFDEYFGLLYCNDMWPHSIVTDKSHLPELPLIEGNETIEEITTLEQQGQLTTRYTEKAVDFINRKKTHPFFLYFAHTMPHVPLAVSDKFKGKSKQGLYGDVMMEIDWSVGKVMKALEENGIAENTLIIFASDNGPWLNFGNHAGSAGALREGKLTTFQGGQQVPCIMRWDNKVPAGVVCNELVSGIDFLPTIAAITEAKLPEHPIDGINMLPLITGKVKESPRETFIHFFAGIEAFRYKNWKLVFPHDYSSYNAIPGEDGKPGKRIKTKAGLSLYNLQRDAGERYDVKEKYPQIVEKIQSLANEQRKIFGDILTGDTATNVRYSAKLEDLRK
ncbi:MAG: sulfatase [Bacteroidota bacterium]